MFENKRIVKQKYKIKKAYSGGGMGLVYCARHLGWKIDVAIKHPRSEFLQKQSQVDAFHAECEIWASLGLNPYVATCFYSLDIEGIPCVVSEFLPGGSLQDAIQSKEVYRGDDNQVLSRLLTIAASTAWGLASAHHAELIHCDVKPGNMLLTEYGTAKISDFGLAVALRSSLFDAKAAGLTVAFASPEQITGRVLTPSADVWSWAASMLSLFMGGISWENGAACRAVIQQFLDEGGKAYRIPAVPVSFAELLKDCFIFNPDERLSDFDRVADRVCEIHESLLGCACPAREPDLELISSDSLNNRAVSLYDLSDIPGVNRLLRESLAIDPLHPEANFNSAVISIKTAGGFSKLYADSLLESTKYDFGEYRAWLYLACLSWTDKKTNLATEYLLRAQEIGGLQYRDEIERIWSDVQRGKLYLVLASPISGEDLALDSKRFCRLMEKAEIAIREQRVDDAHRYILMCGDIPGFARHPARVRLHNKLNL
jgi:serine/threonine protein kinase